MVAAAQASTEQIWQWLGQISDPEVPAISIVDLGIVRAVEFDGSQCVVTLTPTYSGCPAMEMISDQVRESLASHGIVQVQLQTRLSPAWTTDWMSGAAKEKLRDYGIAPPQPQAPQLLSIAPLVACPRCHSTQTEQLSKFGSTACKALYRCLQCLEPFDYFKPH